MINRILLKHSLLAILATTFLLLTIIVILPINLNAAVDFTSLGEISSQTTIVKSAAMFNPRTKTFFCRITITNPGTDTFKSPIVAVIDDFTISNASYSATFMDTDDMIDIDTFGDVNPIYVISNGDLEPGGSVYRNIQIAFRDSKGNLVRPCPFSFNIRAFATQSDQNPPEITIQYPLNASTLGTNIPKIIICYSDDESGINTNSLNILLNAQNKTNFFTITDKSATYQTTNEINSGSNDIAVTLNDYAGNSANALSNFTVNLSPSSSLYVFCLKTKNWIYQSPGDGTYTQYPIPAGLETCDFTINSLHLAHNGSGLYFSLPGQEGIYYSPGDASYGLFMTSAELGIPGQYIDALYLDYSNIVYFSVMGSGDILNSSGDGTCSTYMTANALGISGMDIDALYMAANEKVYFSTVGDGKVLESSGGGTNTVFLNPSALGVPGYDLNAFSAIKDTTMPNIQIDQPFDGSVTNLIKPTIIVSFNEKDSGINTSGLSLNSFTASINGTDYSSSFTVTQTDATYQLTSDLPVGNNTITATISDRAGNTSTATSHFRVAILRAIQGATPTSGSSPLTVYFTTNGEDPAGTIEIFRWDFNGNGSWDTYDTVARDYTHTYSTAGTYNATLYVKSSTGATATASITITVQNNPPVATADVVPSNGPVPLTVTLKGSGSDPDGSIVRYEWDFDGDGTYDWSSTSTGITTHTYTIMGNYQAVFKVTDNSGLTATAIAVTTVVRANPPGSPTATASANPATGNAPLNINFTGTAIDPDNDIVRYEWDFEGDGTYDWSSSTTGNTSHVYNEAGTHVASFRVTDSTGLTGIDQILIKVNISVSLSVASNTIGFFSVTDMTASASSQYSSSYPPNNAIDNNTGTYWVSCYNCTPYYGYNEFIEISFSQLQRIAGITLSCYSDYYSISKGRIEIYDINGAIIFSQENTFSGYISSISFPAVENAKRVRLVVLETSGFYSTYYYLVITEFQVASTPMAGQQAEPTGTNINTSISAGTQVSILIKDTQDNTIRTLVNNEARAKGSYADYWNCKDDNGMVVNDGVYYAILQYLLDGQVQTYDLTNTTGGTRYDFPYGSGCDQRDGGFKLNFSPFDDDFVAFNFKLCSAQEITMFVGPLWAGTDEARIRTLVNRKVYPAGNHTIYWDGLDDNGNIAEPPSGDNLIIGAWRYTLPTNALCITGGSPEIISISATPNYYSPFSDKCDQNGNGEGVVIDYFVSEDVAEVELRVYSLQTGAILRTAIQNNISAGDNTFFWDGKNNNGEYVDIGDYRVGLIARDAEGNESMWRYSLIRIDY